jgi:hypothetical protein
LKATGEFNPAVREWEAKPAADKKWANIKTFISAEYAKENKQNKLLTKHFKANAMQEQAEITEELIANLTDNPHPGQRSIIGFQSRDQKELHNPTSSTRQPQAKSGRESNSNIQESL